MSFEFEANGSLGVDYGFDDDEFVASFDDLLDGEEFDSIGVDPNQPTEAKPGSSDKVMMLAARYAAGLPLWHDEDCYDHAPEQNGEEEDEGAAVVSH